MKSYISELNIKKLLLDSTNDAMPLYEYCKANGIIPFIDLNPSNTGHIRYKDGFTINEDGIPICKMSLPMSHNNIR